MTDTAPSSSATAGTVPTFRQHRTAERASRVGLLSALHRFVAARIHEIRIDPALRVYGACLALSNLLTAVFWTTTQPLDRILSSSLPVCWPFFESCGTWRVLGPHAIDALLASLVILSAANAVLFANDRLVPAALISLVVLSSVKTALILQDYRLVLNQHYMAAWALVVYLFVPSKRRSLLHLTVAFYVWAGLLKLNHEWLSGAALYGRRPLDLPAALVPAECVYVVILELGAVFGILSRRAWAFWGALIQLVLFHIASFWVVGFFYPVLMFLLLSIVPMGRLIREPSAEAVRPAPRVVGLSWRYERKSTYLVLAMFSIMQMIPRLFPGDPSITGEGRVFALNMFDAPTRCVATVTPRVGSNVSVPEKFNIPFLQPRIACDPIVYLEAAKQMCKGTELRPRLEDFDLTLASGRRADRALQLVVSIQFFCASSPRYSFLRHNPWIRAG